MIMRRLAEGGRLSPRPGLMHIMSTGGPWRYCGGGGVGGVLFCDQTCFFFLCVFKMYLLFVYFVFLMCLYDTLFYFNVLKQSLT